MASVRSQDSVILAAVEVRSQMWDVSRLPRSCGSPYLVSCVELTSPLLCMPLTWLCTSPFVCAGEHIRWCGNCLLPAQLLPVSPRESNQTETTLVVNCANRMQVVTSFILHGIDVLSMLL